ncbi:tRNA uridine 5-carboxymethylaminomethyl modification enzyme MnmG [Clostridia bacterium]|nr:tRNA uridine 5-carboxymethylaminomethyl modification enzyme MnmG [Clostridia bacterium]
MTQASETNRQMTYDVIVVGAGHAGCEAALSAARLGCQTLLLTISLDSIAHMPCNPSIGGTGKGQLVKEIDALGGEMGTVIDKVFLQSRMLNRSKGPAVWSPRAQADKARYHLEMKRILEQRENLHLRQGEVSELLFAEETDVMKGVSFENREVRKICGVRLKSGTVCRSRTVVLATGTYLNSRVFVSDHAAVSGPSGFAASTLLADAMRAQGFELRRFKTGTPARVLGRSLDYTKLTSQLGDVPPLPFSYLNRPEDVARDQVPCWLTYTNPKGHRIVADNITKTAPYGGHTTGVGPRYCLSIEDKVSRFPDREKHQVFLEPEGLETDEVYIQGMSTSLPEDIQEAFYRTIPGLEQAIFTRYAYSIEYDCLNPLVLEPSLAHKQAKGLYCAGQINGTSGYEEAAAQGLMAGVNAARFCKGETPFLLGRDEAYIGVLIDDLVTKGTDEPYRIMTSRAEFRLVLRQDNADLRLTEKGYELGLATSERVQRMRAKRAGAAKELARLRETRVPAAGTKVKNGTTATLAELLARPEISYDDLAMVDQTRPDLPPEVVRQAVIEIKYAGYIEKQNRQIAKFAKAENRKIPQDLDYAALGGLRTEAVQKLSQIRPASIGQASRISGVSPADISVLMIHLTKINVER